MQAGHSSAGAALFLGAHRDGRLGGTGVESFPKESRNSRRRGDGLEGRVGRYGTSIQVIV